jgi:CRP/FNR family transcriptional regulator, cyclic AMP receptor protein
MTALLTEGSLKSHPFLNGSSLAFLNHLEEFATEVSFKRGDVIFKECDFADRFYLICEGKVQLEAGTNGDLRVVIQVLGPGEALGWSWLFPPFQWHFSARALEPCEMVELNAAALLVRAEEDPPFGYELMKRTSKQVIRRLHATRQRFVQEMVSRKGGEHPI